MCNCVIKAPKIQKQPRTGQWVGTILIPMGKRCDPSAPDPCGKEDYVELVCSEGRCYAVAECQAPPEARDWTALGFNQGGIQVLPTCRPDRVIVYGENDIQAVLAQAKKDGYKAVHMDPKRNLISFFLGAPSLTNMHFDVDEVAGLFIQNEYFANGSYSPDDPCSPPGGNTIWAVLGFLVAVGACYWLFTLGMWWGIIGTFLFLVLGYWWIWGIAEESNPFHPLYPLQCPAYSKILEGIPNQFFAKGCPADWLMDGFACVAKKEGMCEPVKLKKNHPDDLCWRTNAAYNIWDGTSRSVVGLTYARSKEEAWARIKGANMGRGVYVAMPGWCEYQDGSKAWAASGELPTA